MRSDYGNCARMTTRAAKVVQAKAAAVAARKRKARQLEQGRLEMWNQYDRTTEAIAKRRQHDEATKNMIIRGDTSWRKGKGKAIAGSEGGLYPNDAIVEDDCAGKAREKVEAWLQTEPEIGGFVPYVPNGKRVWRQ